MHRIASRTSVPNWLTENYTLVNRTIIEHDEEEKKKFCVERSNAYSNEKETFHISEIRRLSKTDICHRDGHTSNAIMEHEDWLLDFWQQNGLPELLIEEGGLYGMRDVFGDIVLNSEYDEIKLDLSRIGLFCLSDFVVRKGDKWGVVWKDRSIRVPFEYEIYYYGSECFVVRKDGRYGVIQENRGNIEILVDCRMDAIMYHNIMDGLIIFKKNNRYGWCGCLFPEKNSDAVWDEVYMPNEEYFFSDAYDDDIETFVAVQNKQYYDIEYWTSK